MSKLIKCKSCGNDIAQDSNACPKCGSPNKKKGGCFTLIFGCVALLIGIVFLIAAASTDNSKDKSGSETNEVAKTNTASDSDKKKGSGSGAASAVPESKHSAPVGKASDPAPAIDLPEAQLKFLQVVQAAQSGSAQAGNDMARGGVLAVRNNTLKGMDRRAQNWVGKVLSLSSNSEGKGVLEIEVAPKVILKTWNNSLSDIEAKTLLEPGSDIFNSAAALKKGEKVQFTGTFVPDDETGFSESSMTLNGKLGNPEFIFRFENVGPTAPKKEKASESGAAGAASQPKPAAPAGSASSTPPVSDLPEAQLNFLQVVKAAQNSSAQADNDMARGGVLATRNKALKGMDRRAQNWIGKVRSLSSNSDGKGVLEIEVAPKVVLKTWNNSLSDFEAKTLLEPGSDIFNSAAALKKGDKVQFNGSFVPDDETGFSEGSMTLNGKLGDPEFIFRFESIKK